MHALLKLLKSYTHKINYFFLKVSKPTILKTSSIKGKNKEYILISYKTCTRGNQIVDMKPSFLYKNVSVIKKNYVFI